MIATQPIPAADLTTPDRTPFAYLPFIDGLRGLAALYVVFHHIYYDYSENVPATERIFFSWARPFGHEAVDLFIVISGYCLAIPVLNGRSIIARQFLGRRAKRILPPYYFSILLFLCALLVSSNGLDWIRSRGVHVGSSDHFNPINLATHLALIHNWFPQWKKSLAGPMWSIATEFQIYVVFALVLAPLWRKWGLVLSTIAAWVLGLLPMLVTTTGLDYCCPWYLGLFSLGLWSAKVGRDACRSAEPADLRPWLAASTVAFAVAVWVSHGNLDTNLRLASNDAVWGVAAAAWLATLTRLSSIRASYGGRVPILESKPVVWLGTISYTLYLQHTVLLMKMRPLINHLHLRPTVELPLMFGVAVPAVVLCSWALWWLVERPSLRWRNRAPRSIGTEPAAERVRGGPASVPCVPQSVA